MQLWAQAVNDSSYLFEQALPYFQRSVNFTSPNAAVRLANATAGYDADAFDVRNGGPVRVSYPNYAMPFSTWMKLGVNDIGIEETKDFNSGSLMGSDAFLTVTDSLPLIVYDNTVAQRIVLDAKKRATGVQISSNITLRAQREVILSAGAIQSPQLLMLSGNGPEETLRSHAIDVLVDLPGVGQNMWDHPFFAPSYRVRDTFTSFATHLLENLRVPNGPLGSPIADFLAWEKIPPAHRKSFDREIEDDLARFPPDWPEEEASLSDSNLLAQTLTSLPLNTDQPKDGYQYASIMGSALAFPGHHSFANSTVPSHHSSIYTPLPTGGTGGGKTHTDCNDHPQPTTTIVAGHPSGSVSTITETITKTTFKPCSTPIHTQSGTTYYSTWLTASTYETTTCYTTHVPTRIPSPPPTTFVNLGLANSCPPPSTVTVTVTVSSGGNTATESQTPAPAPNGGSESGPEPCETITYADTYGYTRTVVIPPIYEPTNTATTHSTRVGTTTKPTLPVGTGTGTAPSHSHTRGSPSGTGGGQAPTETKRWHFERRMILLFPYSAHRDANVLGLVNMLRFANTGRLKPIHYTSSISACGVSKYLTGQLIPENQRPDFDMEDVQQHIGYTQSKVVAAQIAWNAMANGLPVTIHRPGLFIPVDFVCSAILRISLGKGTAGQAYNLVQPDQSRTVTWEEMFGLLSQLCSPALRRVGPDEVLRIVAEDQGQRIKGGVAMLEDKLRESKLFYGLDRGTMAVCETRNMREALAEFPEVLQVPHTAELLRRYFPVWAAQK
ncbi:hypothetical protein CFD26_100767 [Aspergillus turcosus]|uniref:Glucose-methanol-choline oxidoreductase N-terminal domain-containing protein n=1 Tax=Aspergillus turcosus TaxID=1245748 RepID=A0A3R7HPY6_9EURO|nr:hypothetical protein CFD26_100767 [Aspergillus turcosus]